MSIARTSPHKYKFQHICTVWVALTQWEHKPKLWVERVGEEDATLQLEQEGARCTIEIQVKGEAGNIDAEKLEKWLAHFPEGAHTGSLFERLRDDSQRIVLFVLSGRLSDSVCGLRTSAAFSLPAPLMARAKEPLSPAHAQELLNAVGTSYAGKRKELPQRRHTQCQNLLASTEPRAFRGWLQRVFIVENTDRSSIQDLVCTRILPPQFHIPAQQSEWVLRDCTDVVFEKIGEPCDIIPSLDEVLCRYQADRIFRSRDPYVTRGDESEMSQRLQTTRVLMLTGAPQCGKTYTARWLAQNRQGEGVHCRELRDIDEA